MRRSIWCAAALCVMSAGQVKAQLIATLKGPGGVSTLQVPPSGGTFNISVNLTRPAGTPALLYVNMSFIGTNASGPVSATLNGSVGGICSSGTGTRFNSPEWECDPFAVEMPTPGLLTGGTPRGPYGSTYAANGGVWSTPSSLMGYINVTFGAAPGGRYFEILPVNVYGVTDTFEDASGSGVRLSIQYICEPPPLPPSSLHAVPSTICVGGTSTLAGTIGSGGNQLVWYQGDSCSGSPTSEFVFPTTTTTYSARSQDFTTGCRSSCGFSTATVTVVADPSVSITTSDQTICAGSAVTLMTLSSGGTGSPGYQWQTATSCAGTFADIPGATSSSLTVTPSMMTSYRVRLSYDGSGCNTATSECVTISVPNCDDGNACTDDTCSGGVCLHTPICRSITSWRSLRNHSGIGDLPIAIDPIATGNAAVAIGGPTIETRGTAVTGGTGISRIQVEFDGPATAPNVSQIFVTGYTTTYPDGTATLGSPLAYTPTTATMINATTMEMTFAPPLPDQSCFAIALGANVIAETVTGDLDVVVRALNGDANLNGTLTNSDVLLTKSKFNAGAIVDAGANLGNALYDFNLSGTINNSDVLYCKAQFNAQTYTRSALCP